MKTRIIKVIVTDEEGILLDNARITVPFTTTQVVYRPIASADEVRPDELSLSLGIAPRRRP